MTSINDFATTYMCQSLPFGGVKESGFDRFAGIEGLRGLTVPKAVAEDRWGQPTAAAAPAPSPARQTARLPSPMSGAVPWLGWCCNAHSTFDWRGE